MKRFHNNQTNQTETEREREREGEAKRPIKRKLKSDRDILLGGIPPRRSICITRKSSQSSISSISETTISTDEYPDLEVDLMEYPISKKRKCDRNPSDLEDSLDD
jgi:hypothetical protein